MKRKWKRKIEKEEGISVKPSYKKSISLYVMITKLRASLFFSLFGVSFSKKKRKPSVTKKVRKNKIFKIRNRRLELLSPLCKNGVLPMNQFPL